MELKEIQNCDYDRLYRINYYDLVWLVPARNAAGEQVLLGEVDFLPAEDAPLERIVKGGPDEYWILAVFFSAEGQYLRYAFRPIERKPDPSLPVLPHRQLAQIVQGAKAAYLRDLGMTPGDIRVRHFAFPAWRVGTAEWLAVDFPQVQRALAAGDPLPDDDLITQWRENRQWVLLWGKEYWMSEDGEITDT
jgi:hypothetical protein